MLKKESIILIVISIILLIVFLSIALVKNRLSSDYNFKVYFFNAGKADAILISKNNKYMMIDTGEESLKEEIFNYLKKNNINRLEYLIITHFDKDHVGSASFIIDNFEVGEVLQSNYPKTSTYYNNYVQSLCDKKIDAKTVKGDYEIALEDVIITVNGPKEVYEKNESNNSSLIVSMTNGNNKFLFMGDAENARIKDFVDSNNLSYDFIKIPYHGRSLKRLEDLLNSTNPKYGVVTCSLTEGCEKDTIAKLKKYNIKYYMTKNGSISVYSNKKDIQIR